MKAICYVVCGLLAVLFFKFFAACSSEQGEQGEKGEEGEIIFPPSSGTSLVLSCEYKWDDLYMTRYSVWRKKDGLTRVSGICTRKIQECKYHDYTTKEYPIDSAGYSRAEVNDGLVIAYLEGPDVAYFERNGSVVSSTCKIPVGWSD